MIVFSCPGCAKELQVKAELAGKKGKCPHCRAVLTVPAPDVQKTLVGTRRAAGVRTPVPAARPAADAQTLPPGAPGPRPARMADDTLAPQPADPTPELTEFLEPPRGPGELGRLGHYRIQKVLGAGGMGVVFQAEDTLLMRPVALKALLPGLAASAAARQRFLREAQTAAQLQHDHVVTIYQVAEANNTPYLAMQLLQGEALDARLTREPTLPPDEVLRIGRETAEGLAAAHERGLVHRDIKPANLFLEAPKGRVKILDFGLARPAGGDSKLTQMGTVVGTPGYLAPEQANGKPVDARGDLFSLGCVLYRLTTGELPFRGEDMLSLLAALATTEPAAPRDLNPDVPAPLSDLILRLLSKDPAGRPASARAVADELAALAGGPALPVLPMTAVLEDDKPEPLAVVPAEPEPLDVVAAEPEARRVVVKKQPPGVADRPVPRPRRDSDDEGDLRRPRREDGFPMWVVWTGVGVALFLLVGGVSVYLALRNKEEDRSPSEVVDLSENKDRNKEKDKGKQQDPKDRNQGKGDPIRPAPPPDAAVPAWKTQQLPGGGSQWLAFHPDNRHFVSAAHNGDRFAFWDLEKPGPEHVEPILGGDRVTQPPRYSSDGKKVLLGVGQAAYLYDVEKKMPIARFASEEVKPLLGVMTADTLLGVGFADTDTPLAVFQGRLTAPPAQRVLGVFEIAPRRPRGKILVQPPGSSLRAVLVNPDGRHLIVIEHNDRMVLWDLPGGAVTNVMQPFDQPAKCWALSPDGKVFLSSHRGNIIRVWDARSGRKVRDVGLGARGELDFVGFSPDGKVAVCCGQDGKVRLWDAATGEKRAELAGQGFMTGAAVAADVTNAVAASWTGQLFRYRVPPKP